MDQEDRGSVPTNSMATTGGLSSIVSAFDNDALQSAAESAGERIDIIKDFVAKRLIPGVDYGAATNKTDKPTLLKPGQEKIFMLFSITTRLFKDVETYDMLGKPPGTVVYKCLGYGPEGQVIGEGRGAAVVGENASDKYAGRDANSTIKIAEKRARVDLCLSLGFSEFFSQATDLPPQTSSVSAARQASQKQKDFITRLLDERGVKDRNDQLRTVAKTLGVSVKDVGNISAQQASEMIDKIKAGEFVQSVVPKEEPPQETHADALEAEIVDNDVPITAENMPLTELRDASKGMMDTLNIKETNDVLRTYRDATGSVAEPKDKEGWLAVYMYLENVFAAQGLPA